MDSSRKALKVDPDPIRGPRQTWNWAEPNLETSRGVEA